MIIDSPTLIEVLAAELDPTDLDGAENRIETTLAPVAKWVHSFKGWFEIRASITGPLAFICLLIWAQNQKNAWYFYYLFISLVVVTVSFVLTPQFLWRRLYRGPVFGWYPKVFANPDLAPVKSFIARCANGKIKTKDENNARVDVDFFENILSILLLSSLASNRILIKSGFPRRSYSSQLRVESINGLAMRINEPVLDRLHKIVSAEEIAVADMLPMVAQNTQLREETPEPTNFSESPDLPINADVQNVAEAQAPMLRASSQALVYKDHHGPEPHLASKNPDHHWLVGGSREKYEAARNKAFDHFFPSKQSWKKFVLDGGRYELRSGGQVGAINAATKEIQAELTRVFGHCKSPSGRKSDASIKRMLSSGKANRNIIRHFDD